ncbi:MAG: protein translocase subunit SecF [Candidatus Methanofastidiosia archaeon]
MNLDNIIDRINITGRDKKILVGVPLALLLCSILLIIFNGVALGTDLEGGTHITVRNIDTDTFSLQELLQKEFGSVDIHVKKATGLESGLLFVEAPTSVSSSKMELYFRENYPDAQLSFSVFDSTVGSEFQSTAIKAIIFAFIGMAIIVFLVFRTPIPSMAVVLSAASDIVITMALMSLLNVTLTLGTIAALLMVIGYSVDSDILLTTRLLKRRGDINNKVQSAMKTGVTMTLTTLSAVIVLFIVSQNPTLDSIAIVLIFALTIDLLNTWMLNTGILLWFLGRQAASMPKRRQRA